MNELWRTVPYLHELPTEVIGKLSTAASPHTYQAAQMIFNEGDPVAGLFLVESGTVKVCRFSKEGREYILQTFQRGDTFNDVAALDGGANPATAVAMSEARLWRIARPDLKTIAYQHPELAWALIESISRRTRHLVGVVQDLAMRSVRGRLAHLLLEQAKASSEGRAIPMMTQDEMASHLGTVREVVGRALRSLAAAGIIEIDHHRIVIHDSGRLAEESEV